jgi:hypothetical protein
MLPLLLGAFVALVLSDEVAAKTEPKSSDVPKTEDPAPKTEPPESKK